MDHPQYGPDLVLSNSIIFWILGKHLTSKQFSVDSVISAVVSLRQTLDPSSFKAGYTLWCHGITDVYMSVISIWRSDVLCLLPMHQIQNEVLVIRVLPYFLTLFACKEEPAFKNNHML
jgi:hypothetical protein